MSVVPLPLSATTAGLPRKRFAREEVERLMDAGLLEGERLELIDGDLIDKTGQKPPHAAGVWNLQTRLETFMGSRIRTRLPIEASRSDRERSLPEPDIRQSLVGCFDEHHRYLLDLLWQQYQFLNRQMAEVEAKVRREMEPHRELIEWLDGVPGIDETVAWTLIAEMGTDMGVFPTSAHVASWAGMCPGTNESAGRQLDTKTRKGNRYLRRALLQAAWAATRKKNSYLRAFFHRLMYRRGWGKAIVALGHKLLVIAYEIMKTRTPYYELGGDYYVKLNPRRPFGGWRSDSQSWALRSLCPEGGERLSIGIHGH